jgi:hypothetical protein
MSSSKDRQPESYPPWIPDGYVIVMGMDNKQYLVPKFYEQDLQLKLGGGQKKEEMQIEKAAGTVSLSLPSVLFQIVI